MSSKTKPASDDSRPKKPARPSRGALARQEAARRKARFPGGVEQVQGEVRAARRKAARAERERVAALGAPDAGMQRGHDAGPGLQIERGRVEVQRDALIPLDPDMKNSPATRGVRGQRVWAPDRLYGKKTITPHQHEAAKRYLDDYEIGHEGARCISSDTHVKIDRGPTLPGPNDRQVNALTRYRAATQRVGQSAEGVLRWCVLRVIPPDAAPTVEGFAQAMGGRWTTQMAVGLLIGALDTLVSFYGISGQEGGGKRRHTIAGHAGHGPPPDAEVPPLPRRVVAPA